MINAIKSHFTPFRKLLYSTIFGRTIMIVFVVLPFVMKVDEPEVSIILAAILLSIRYSLMKPILHASAVGAGIVGIGALLDYLLHNREGSFGFGALVGVLIGLALLLMKNLIVSIWYLLKETFTLYRVYTGKVNLIG